MKVPAAVPPIFRRARDQESFARDGFVVVDLLSASEVGALRDAWSEGAAGVAGMPFSSTIMSDDLAYRRRVHERVARVLAPAVDRVVRGYRFCLGSFVAKQPADARGRVEVHQDWSFVDEERFWSLGFWVPLCRVHRGNGCLRALPGSHLFNRGPRGHGQGFADPGLADLIQDRYLVDVPMAAGQAFVSTQSLIHASPPNGSPDVRVAACALAVPEESVLWFVGGERGAREMGVYAVDDDFYLTHHFGAVPPVERRLALVDHAPEPLDLSRFASHRTP